MTDEKICPFMSPDGSRHYTYCQKGRCMAWVPEHIEQIPGDERYFGREARTIKYPARCALIKTAGRPWDGTYEADWNIMRAIS